VKYGISTNPRFSSWSPVLRTCTAIGHPSASSAALNVQTPAGR